MRRAMFFTGAHTASSGLAKACLGLVHICTIEAQVHTRLKRISSFKEIRHYWAREGPKSRAPLRSKSKPALYTEKIV